MKIIPLAALAAAAAFAGAAEAGVTVTYENPGVVNTTATFTGVSGVETFDSLTPGQQPTPVTTDYGTGNGIQGTYSELHDRLAVAFGGGGNSNFASAAFDQTVSLTLTDQND